jgi:isochorismate hydrolase
MAAIDAYQRDRRVILAVDCVASYDQEHHEISLRYMKDKIASVMSNEEIQKMLASPAGASCEPNPPRSSTPPIASGKSGS